MGVRTFFWEEKQSQLSRLAAIVRRDKSAVGLKVGNAGDLFNRDLIRYLYHDEPVNREEPGKRLLLVGSVVHRAAAGDIVCGVGTKGVALQSATSNPLTIRGVRGPITKAALKDAGHDVSSVRFELDPGLLAAEIYRTDAEIRPEAGRSIFIPHYRDLPRYAAMRGPEIVSVDARPRDFVAEIARAEYVYSSSLHGVIFAHSIGRPCTLVAPANPEPEIKYRDYFASIGLDWSTPLPIEEALSKPLNEVVEGVPNSAVAFDFPSYEELVAAGVASPGSAS